MLFKRFSAIVITIIFLGFALEYYAINLGLNSLSSWLQMTRWTDLHRAAKSGDELKIKQGLESEADINSVNDEGATPLLTAIAHAKSNIINISNLLLKHGANPNICTKDKWCPIHAAAEEGHTELVDVLFRANSDLNIQSKDGSNPLIVAIYNNHSETAAMLVKLGGTGVVNTCKEDGWCSLHAAVHRCNKPVVELLLSNGAANISNVDEMYFGKYNIHNLLEFHECNKDLAKIIKSKLYPLSPTFQYIVSSTKTFQEIRREKILNQKQMMVEDGLLAKESKQSEKFINRLNIDKEIDKSPIYYIYAKILLEQGDYEKALYNIDQAIHTEKQIGFEEINEPINELKAEILLRQGNYKSAYEISEKLCERAIQEFPLHALVMRAWSEVGLGKTLNAEASIKATREHLNRPNTRKDGELLVYLSIVQGEIEAKKENFGEAFKSYSDAEKCLKSISYNPKADLHGYILEKLILFARNSKKFAESEHYTIEYEKIFGKFNDRAMRIGTLSE